MRGRASGPVLFPFGAPPSCARPLKPRRRKRRLLFTFRAAFPHFSFRGERGPRFCDEFFKKASPLLPCLMGLLHLTILATRHAADGTEQPCGRGTHSFFISIYLHSDDERGAFTFHFVIHFYLTITTTHTHTARRGTLALGVATLATERQTGSLLDLPP